MQSIFFAKRSCEADGPPNSGLPEFGFHSCSRVRSIDGHSLADAAALPLEDASVDLAVAFMSLQDVDEMPAVIREVARVLESGGRLCLAIIHPLNSAGRFEQSAPDARFIINGDYLGAFHYADTVERDGLMMTFHSQHRPVEAYFIALENAGLLVEALREPSVPEHAIVSEAGRRWQRLPLFLHLRVLRP